MLAIIGGSGFYTPGNEFEPGDQAPRETPFGDTSSDILLGRWQDLPIAFLARHGPGHLLPPHRVNYRANIWALKKQGVRDIIAINAVGGISREVPPQAIVVPDQLIDYSSGREHTYFEGDDPAVTHVDFSWPYSAELRRRLIEAGLQQAQPLVVSGTYGSTNGPRLETAAEINRLRQDGCTIVGMTGMPEAALARELEMEYACLALVVNWAAGIENKVISMSEIMTNLEQGMAKIRSILSAVVSLKQQ